MSRNVEDDALVAAAYALLMAAILLRDMAGAMPPNAQASMPPDIRDRLYHTMYQDTFDGLPADIQRRARQLVESDPLVIRAREIDQLQRAGDQNAPLDP